MPRILKSLLLVAFLAACAPHVEGLGPEITSPALTEGEYRAADGVTRPLRIWSVEQPKAIIIGVHGFNDYGNFLNPGFPEYLQDQAIELITFDQRGFGESEKRGLWAGQEALVEDLSQIIQLVHQRAPDTPLFVLGESMGGAVSMVTLSSVKSLPIDGLILSAPAVWGTDTWPWYQKASLAAFSYTMPGLILSGGGFVQPTDNMEIWRNWSQDPLVITSTRVDALWGVSQLMDKAVLAAPKLELPTLVLYGEKDEVIPLQPTAKMIQTLKPHVRVAFYPEGWHMLTRDHNGPKVWADIVHWINASESPLPSNADKDARTRILKKAKQ